MDLSEIPDGILVRHPWELARAKFFIDAAKRYGLVQKPVSVLDVGSGDAYFARRLSEELSASSRVVCFDPNYSDDFLQKAASLPDRAVTFTRVGSAEVADLLLLLDVLEHVPNDTELLTDLVRRNLRPGGHALISVPAFMALFTRHDVSLGHYRRYTAASLRRVVRGAGLQIVSGGGLFHTLLPARALQKLGERMTGTTSIPNVRAQPDGQTALGRWSGGVAATAAVNGLLRVDNAVSAWAARVGLELPGLSVWVLARKA